MEPTDDFHADQELARRLQAEWDEEDQYYLSHGPSEEDEDDEIPAPKLPPRPTLPPRPAARPRDAQHPNRRYPDVPLDATHHIRVLELQPGRYGGDIFCTLVVQDLDLSTQPTIPDPKIKSRPEADFDKPAVWEEYRRQCADPPYVALSYTWGDPKPEEQKPVNLHGIDGFRVTPNLHACLARLRKREDVRRLWIDQLCIHQDNLEERAAQVRAMAHIYAQAIDVYVWLGDTTTLNELPNEADSAWAYRRAVFDQLQEAVNRAASSWWTRAWVVQEFMMARRELMMCFGLCQVRWSNLVETLFTISKERGGVGAPSADRFKHLAKGLWQEGRQVTIDPIKLLGSDLLNYASMGLDSKEDKPFDRGPRGLANYSWTVMQTEAKDHRDKVYSLYGLMTDGERARIEIDYGKDVAQVFAEATYAAIVESGGLGFMRHASSRMRSDPVLPSWVVDFAPRWREVKGGSKVANDDFGRFILARVPIGTPWSARQNSVEMQTSLGGARKSTLTVRGLVFDTIHKRLAADQRDQDSKGYTKAWMKGATKFIGSPRGLFSQQTTVLTEDEQSLMSDVTSLTSNTDPYRTLEARGSTKLGPPMQSQSTSSGMDKKLSILSIRLFTAWNRRYLRERLGKQTDDIQLTWSIQVPWISYFIDLSNGWSLYVTKCGFLGRGHADTREGDAIVLPYGSQQPMLLRPLPGEDAWNFMGFTQVNGLMAGVSESVLGKILPDLELEERDFVLT